MRFFKENNSLCFKHQYETMMITPWGKNALRVRATKYPQFTQHDWALEEAVPDTSAEVSIEINEDNTASIQNGRLSLKIDASGILTYYRDGKKFLKEYHRDYDQPSCPESRCLRIRGREYKAIIGGDYTLKVRFESNNGEKIYGMGQYQQKYLDLKGCTLELAQRNSQVSIPFAVSSLGYGFLWNHPGVGTATFGKNYTEWEAKATKQMDYWITVDDNPAKIMENYTEVTGRTPMFPEELLGLWQCKLRYRTQEEVLGVARKYKELGIHIDVIVIDFFHWTRQGDWQFDKKYWPDPKAMCEELHAILRTLPWDPASISYQTASLPVWSSGKSLSQSHQYGCPAPCIYGQLPTLLPGSGNEACTAINQAVLPETSVFFLLLRYNSP